jgi:hypothetical protein
LMNARRSIEESKEVSGLVIWSQFVNVSIHAKAYTRRKQVVCPRMSSEELATWNATPSHTMIPAHVRHLKRSLQIER